MSYITKWNKLSKWLRKQIVSCQWCNKPKDETKLKYLEVHHLGRRGYEDNQDYVMCRLNLIVVCQPCHVILEPFSKVLVKIIKTDNLGKPQRDVKCCGSPYKCRLYNANRNT